MATLSCDGHPLAVGDTVFFVSTGDQPGVYANVVGELVSEFKLLYTKPDIDGYIGCRAGSCYYSKAAADLAFEQWKKS